MKEKLVKRIGELRDRRIEYLDIIATMKNDNPLAKNQKECYEREVAYIGQRIDEINYILRNL